MAGGDRSEADRTAESRVSAEVPFALVAAALTCGAVAAYIAVGATAALVAYVVFGALLVQLSVIDLAEHRLPNQLTLRAALVGAVLLPVATAAALPGSSLARAVVAAAVSLAAHLLLHIASPGGFGMGDVKLAPTIGAHLASCRGTRSSGVCSVLSSRARRWSACCWSPAGLVGGPRCHSDRS